MALARLRRVRGEPLDCFSSFGNADATRDGMRSVGLE